MRLSESEKETIQEVIYRYDRAAEIYLFGSRVYNHLKGGDIDVLLVSSTVGAVEKFDILAQLKEALEDQKIDLVLYDPTHPPTAFVAKVMKDAVRIPRED